MYFRIAGCACLAAALLGGCSSTQPSSAGHPAVTEDQTRAAENSFRPSDHDPLPAHGQRTATSPADSTQAPVQEESPNTSSGELVQGFRVQAFSSTNIDDARAKKQDLELLFPGEWFYLEYDSPSYKIRAGNFVNRFEADRFARAMIEKGLPDAWTVPEKVYAAIGRRPLPPPPPAPEPQPEVK